MLKELQEPPSLLHLVLEEVVRKDLEVEELPPTLRAEVVEWPARRREVTRERVARIQAGPGRALVQGIKDLWGALE